MTIGIGGWGSRRKPMSLVRAILRVRPHRPHRRVATAGPTSGCCAPPARSQAPGVRLRVARLDPAGAALPRRPRGRRRSRSPSSTRACCSGAVRRGAAPAVPADARRAGLGRAARQPATCGPSTRPTATASFVAMPALQLDAALVHLNRADARGNGQFLGPDLVLRRPVLPGGRPRLRVRASGSCRPARCSTRAACTRCASTAAMVARRRRGARRRALHLVRPRLRPRRGVPARVRRRRQATPDAWAAFARALPRRSTRRPTSAAVTRRGVVTRRAPAPRSAWSPAPRRSAATARSWPARWRRSRGSARGWPAPRSSPTCCSPTARRYLRRRQRRRRVEGWLPFRAVFDVVAARDAARDDGRQPDRPLRQPEHLVHRRLAQPEGAAARLARRARQHRQPPHQLLGAAATRPRVFVRAGRLRVRRRLRPGGGRPEAARFHEIRVVVTNLAVFDFATPDHAHAPALACTPA